VAGVVTASDGDISVVDVGGGRVEVAALARPGDRVRLCLHPEDIILTRAEEPALVSSARNRLRGVVTQVTRAGSRARLTVDCGFPLVAAVTSRSVDELGLAVGMPISAIFKASAVHLIPAGGSLDTSPRRGL